MKGIIFNLLEDFVTETWGDSAYDDLASQCDLETTEPFVGPGTYPDKDLVTLATAVAEKAALPLPDALRAFAAHSFPKLAKKYPVFLDSQPDARSFLRSVEGVIHVEVRKLFPEARTPRFLYEDASNGDLIMTYQSERNLYPVVEGFIEGVALHYQEGITVRREETELEGKVAHRFHLRFSSTSGAP